MFQFPSSLPDHPNSKPHMWHLQLLLGRLAVERLGGALGGNYQVCQPRFHDGGPGIVLFTQHSQVVAYLSENAAAYWPTAVYELAHETVHLLQPRIGYASQLEEGVAVAFSVEMSTVGGGEAQTPNSPIYQHAWALYKSLPGSGLDAAQKIFSKYGSLTDVTGADLQAIFPSISNELGEELCSKCITDA